MITNQEIIITLKDVHRKKVPIFLSTDNLGIVFQTLIIDVKDDYLTLHNNIPHEHISKATKAKSLYLQVEMLRLQSNKIDSDGCNIIFPLKHLHEIAESRKAKRYFFSDENATIEVQNPIDNETMLSKTILDLSSTGISIKSPTQSKLFEPGTKFRNLKVIIDGEMLNQSDCEVVYSRKFLDLKGKYYYQIGLRFD